MKRVLFMALAIMVVVAFSAAAVGSQVQDRGIDIVEYDTVYISSSEMDLERPALYDDELLERFGIKLNYEVMVTSGATEKLNLLFAAGDGPEVIMSGVYKTYQKQWGEDGYLVPVEDYIDKLPNYQKLWDESSWNFAHAGARSSDGKLYWLPAPIYQIAGVVWIYRKGAFDKMGLTFPKTTDALYSTLKKIKSADPESVPIPSRWGVRWLLAGHLLAFRTGENGYMWVVDPDTDKLVFGPTTDKCREALKYVNKLYKEKMIDQEFPTGTSQSWTECYAQGKPYIQFTYIGRGAWANNAMKDIDPDANWTYSKDNITAYPEKSQLSTGYGYGAYIGWGPSFTKNCSEEKMERILEYFDWACTEEGQIFHSYGVEGVNFKYVDRKPVVMDHMFNKDNIDGKIMIDYGFFGNYFLVCREDQEKQLYGNVVSDHCEAMLKKQWIKDNIAYDLTAEQGKELGQLETVITDVWKEHATKFIMGTLDPSNDNHWNDYLMTLKKVGFDRVKEIRVGAKKDYWWPTMNE